MVWVCGTFVAAKVVLDYWERNGHSWKFIERHSEDPLSKNGNGNYPSRDRKYDGKHRSKFPMIYYTTATSPIKKTSIEILSILFWQWVLFRQKIIFPNIIKPKKSSFGVSWNTLVLGLGWCGPHSSKMDRIGDVFSPTEFGDRRSGGRFNTHPEMIFSHLCTKFCFGRFWPHNFWVANLLNPPILWEWFLFGVFLPFRPHRKTGIVSKRGFSAMTKVPFLLHLLHCAPGGLPRSASWYKSNSEICDVGDLIV